jgi:transcriptional regulator with XRE-family HTH domain
MRVTLANPGIIDRVIGSRIRAERISRRFDEATFAECVGVTPERLDAFENGLMRVDAPTMVAICKRLDISARHVFAPLVDKPSAAGAIGCLVAAE